MKTNLEKILERIKDEDISNEVAQEIQNLETDNELLRITNEQLEKTNKVLTNGTSPSILNRYRQSNENLRAKNKLLNEQMEKLKRKKNPKLAHLDENEIGVYKRMLDDFNGMERNIEMVFPGREHPIFNRFFELANKYPNRKFIVTGLNKAINQEIDLIQFEIQTQKHNIDIWNKCDELAQSNPDTWEDDVSDTESYLYKVTTPNELNMKIKKLEKDKSKVKDWFDLKNGITTPNTDIKVKNNLYYEIFNEFKRIFDFCKNVGGITQYKANVRVDGFNKADMYSALTRELEKQVGLCEEPNTHNFFYSNGEGRLVPYELNRQFLQYVNENTTFIKYGKKNQYKSGDIINSKVLFEEIPLYCNKVQYRNPNLVGFNNCFYDVINGKIINLNTQAPILPLKNTRTELYLDATIEENPMQDIFENCFSEEDRRTLLAYIGCALYDKGYTQRQESLFIMGKGGTGKTTLTRAICSIFYSVGHQLVTKLTDNNQFGFSMFADSDVVVIDEIQSAPKEFAEKMKVISGGEALPVEKKHYDTISVPAENVPRIFFIGNNFSKKFYEASDNPGVKRRILIIIPTKPIQSLGYKWNDLVSDSSKQWLVKNATEEYVRQNLHKQTIPIGSDNDNEKGYLDEDKIIERVEICTFPEEYFIKKHFDVVRLDNGSLDKDEFVKYSVFHDFITECINKNMLESTVKQGVAQSFIPRVKAALNLPERYTTKIVNGEVTFKGIKAKSIEAIKYISKHKGDLE